MTPAPFCDGKGANEDGVAGVKLEWLAEIDRRAENYLAGNATLVDVDEHHERLRAKLSGHTQ